MLRSMEVDEAEPDYSIQAPLSPFQPRVLPQILAVSVASLAAVIGGMCLGYSSPTTSDFRKKGILTSTVEESWFNSLLALGAIFGCPIAGILVEKVGRKATVMLTSVPYTSGFLLIICAKSYIHLYCGRILTGIGVGMTTLVVPLYSAEVASKNYRGRLGTFLQLNITFGILIAFSLSMLLDAWWLAVACSFLATVLVMTMLFVPETPRWLMKYSDDETAIDSLRWLRGASPEIYEEYNEMQILFNCQEREKRLTLADFRKPSLVKPLVISLGLLVTQQLSGINAIIFNVHTLFQHAGFRGHAAVPCIVIAGVQTLSSLLPALLMDKAGRKLILVLSGIFMSVGCILFGVYYYVLDHSNKDMAWLSLLGMCIYYISFSVGWGPVPWVVMAEIFPVRARGVATAIASTVNWTFAFIMTRFFQNMMQAFGGSWTFWTFALVMAIGVILVAIFMLETKGKSLEEIERHFERYSSSYQEI